MITIEQCPCPFDGCPDYHLVGIGKFVQGSGFTKEEAQQIADLLNGQGDYYVLIESYGAYVKEGQFLKIKAGLEKHGASVGNPLKLKT